MNRMPILTDKLLADIELAEELFDVYELEEYAEQWRKDNGVE